MTAEWEFEHLERRHQRGEFSCGNDALDEFIRRFARPNDQKNTAKTFVALRPGNPRVWGYYSLSMTSVDGGVLPEEERRGLPRVVPAALIGRFAVDRELQRQGLGKRLLMDALYRIFLASRNTAAVCVVLDAIDQKAVNFYQRYGFRALEDHPQHLFLPLSEVEAMFEGQ